MATKYWVLEGKGNEFKNEFEKVNSLDYLGTVICKAQRTSNEIATRPMKGNRCMIALNKLLTTKGMSRAAKIHI